MQYIVIDNVTGEQVTWWDDELNQVFDSIEEAQKVIDNSNYWYACEIAVIAD